MSRKARSFLSLGKFPGLRETEHASRTVLRHETEVTHCSHVAMPLDLGVTGQGQLAFQAGGRLKSGERSACRIREQVRRRESVGRRALNAIKSLYYLYTGTLCGRESQEEIPLQT